MCGFFCAVRLNFVRSPFLFRPQTIFSTSADEIQFHHSGTKISAHWYKCTTAVVFFRYATGLVPLLLSAFVPAETLHCFNHVTPLLFEKFQNKVVFGANVSRQGIRCAHSAVCGFLFHARGAFRRCCSSCQSPENQYVTSRKKSFHLRRLLFRNP